MKTYRINEICEINPKTAIELKCDEEISFIPMNAISVDGKIDTTKIILAGCIKNYSVFQEGDILFAKITPCMENGKGCIADNLKNGYGAGSTEFIVLRSKQEIVMQKWLHLFLSQKIFRLHCQQHMTGSAGQKRVSPKFLANCMISIPPLSEQERIVAHIGELFSQLDVSVKELKTAKERLKVYRQAMLKEAFEGIDTYIAFGRIADSRLGKMLDKAKNTGTSRKYLRNINVRWFSFDLSDLLEMRIEDEEVEKYSIGYGDLIICEGGEPGRCAVWEKDYSIFYQKALHRVRFLDNSSPKFYMYYLWFSSQSGQLHKYFTGTGIKHLTGQSLAKVPVPTTERTIQDSIVEKIESHLSVCGNIEKTIDTALQQAEALRQSILKKAFMGELV